MFEKFTDKYLNEANNQVYKKGQKVLIRLVHKGGVGKYADAMSTSDNTEEARIKKRIKNKITGGYKYELFNGIEVYPSEIVGLAESLNEAKTYRLYMNSDQDEPNEISYEEYFESGTKAEMIKVKVIILSKEKRFKALL